MASTTTSKPVYHIGLFTFKQTLSATAMETSLSSMLTLKERCIHPATGKPYIVSMVATADLVAGNPYGGGYTHALIMTFANKEDWNYYRLQDPVHREFIESNQDWEKGIVLDIGES